MVGDAATSVAVVVPALALLFTVASFWWIYLLRGRLKTNPPDTYAAVWDSWKLRLLLPFVLYNGGAVPKVVTNFRVIVGEHELKWIGTRSTLRPATGEIVDFGSSFAVPGRGVKQVFLEFGQEPARWRPQPATKHRMTLQQKNRREKWKALVEFDWWAPISDDLMAHYVAHRNEYASGPVE